MVKIDRDTNIELLRILAMFFIVVGHFILQTDSISFLSGYSQFGAVFFSSARRVSVSIFLLIGCWFMVDLKFKSERVLNLYFTLLFYTLLIRLILFFFHLPVSTLNTIRAFFPFIMFSLWFVSAYICLILASPFLNIILSWKRTKLKNLLILMFFLIFVLSMLYINMDTKLCVFFSFIFFYLFVGYYKKYLHENINLNKYLLLLFGFIVYCSLVFCKFYCIVNNNDLILKIINSYISDYHCAVNLIISFSIFYFFLNTKIKTNKIINYISTSTLIVYIVHQAPGFYEYLWFNIYHFDKIIHSSYYFLFVVLIPVSLYLVCLFVEFFRKKFIQRIILNSSIYNLLKNGLDKFYKEFR